MRFSDDEMVNDLVINNGCLIRDGIILMPTTETIHDDFLVKRCVLGRLHSGMVRERIVWARGWNVEGCDGQEPPL